MGSGDSNPGCIKVVGSPVGITDRNAFANASPDRVGNTWRLPIGADSSTR